MGNKIKNKIKNYWTKEKRDKHRLINLGKVFGKETCLTMSLNRDRIDFYKKDRMPRIFLSPTGEKIEVDNLRQFCIKNNLHQPSMADVNSGRQKSHKGYRKFGEEIKYKYEMISPSGEVIKFNNISKFSKENDLTEEKIHMLLKGEIKEYQGYNCNKIFTKNYKIKSPNGDIIEFNNISKFCKENNLINNALSKVIRGMQPHTKGYTRVNYYKFRRSDNTIFATEDLGKFCKENNLDISHVNKLIKLKRKSHKGFTLEKII